MTVAAPTRAPPAIAQRLTTQPAAAAGPSTTAPERTTPAWGSHDAGPVWKRAGAPDAELARVRQVLKGKPPLGVHSVADLVILRRELGSLRNTAQLPPERTALAADLERFFAPRVELKVDGQPVAAPKDFHLSSSPALDAAASRLETAKANLLARKGDAHALAGSKGETRSHNALVDAQREFDAARAGFHQTQRTHLAQLGVSQFAERDALHAKINGPSRAPDASLRKRDLLDREIAVILEAHSRSLFGTL